MPSIRSIFISDIHLGTRACQAELLLAFLREYPTEHLYLLGDIIDFWSMSHGIYWTEAQNTVVQKILRMARHGTSVILIPGNHDEALRDYIGISFGNIRLEREWVHSAADSRRYLLIHGDEFDQVTYCHRRIALLGDFAYGILVQANLILSWLRRNLRRPGYWSLAGYAKRKVKTAMNFIFGFENALIHETNRRGLDGIICGHIHWAALRQADGIVYINCGDWVDSCTAIVEHHDGRMELIQWRTTSNDSAKDNSPQIS